MAEPVKVLIADKMDPRAAAIFRQRAIDVDEEPGLTPDELNAIIGGYDGVAVRSSTKINAAAMDAVIGCWDAKYKYLVLRPWMVSPNDFPRVKLVIGRPNHPSYPSGHSCVSSASATVLKRFFPEKKATLDQQVAEAGVSRIYAGIHYSFDVEEGQKLGRSVARWAIRYDRKHGLLAAVLPTIRDGDRDDHR